MSLNDETHLNYEPSSPRPLYRQATRAALVGLAVNLSLGAAKLAAGIVSGSWALLADAVNSLGDSLSGVVVLYALSIAQRPADDDHPYGHTRAEAIAGLSVAVLIVVSAVMILWQAASELFAVHGPAPAWTLWIAGVNAAIKEGLYHYKAGVGKRTGSRAIIANAWDHRADAFCSLAVLIGLAAVRIGGPGFAWADEAAAIVVALAVIVSGVSLYKQSASELLDQQADENLVGQIRARAERVAGVLAVEKLYVRKTGIEYLADIHVEVDAELNVAAGHAIGHRVKDELVQTFPALRDVLVHLEPHSSKENAK